MILDGEYSYFQTNPFSRVRDCGHMTLHFYEESKLSMNFAFMRLDNKEIWNKMIRVFEMKDQELQSELRDEFVLNPTAFFGHQYVLKQFLHSLIDLFESTNCVQSGCDFACVNYMWYKEILEIGNPISVSLLSHRQGLHVINPGLATSRHHLEKHKLFDNDKKLYTNVDGQPTSVVLNYHLNTELGSMLNKKYEELLKEFKVKPPAK